MRRCVMIGMSVAVVLGCLSGVAIAAITPTTRSDAQRSAPHYTPRAGSHRVLVYTRRYSDARHNHLYARFITGRTRSLGLVPRNLIDWSFADPILTAVRFDPSSAYWRDVRWWNVATGMHGTIETGSADVYLGAAPNGVLVTSAPEASTLTVVKRDGTRVALGEPFSGSQIESGSRAVTSTSMGFVVSQDSGGALAYHSWDSGGAFTDLAVVDNPGYRTSCDAVTREFASCAVGSDTQLLPLDGGPAPTSVQELPSSGTGVAGSSGTGVAGSSLFFRLIDRSSPDHDLHLASVPLGSTTPTWSTFATRYPISAYGQIVTTRLNHPTHLLIGAAADHFTQLL